MESIGSGNSSDFNSEATSSNQSMADLTVVIGIFIAIAITIYWKFFRNLDKY